MWPYKKSRFVSFDTLLKRLLNINCPADSIFCGAQRKLYLLIQSKCKELRQNLIYKSS